MVGILSATLRLLHSHLTYCNSRERFIRRYLACIECETEPTDTSLTVNLITDRDTHETFPYGTRVDVEGELLPGTRGAILDVEVLANNLAQNKGTSRRRPRFFLTGTLVEWADPSTRTVLLLELKSRLGECLVGVTGTHASLAQQPEFATNRHVYALTGQFRSVIPLWPPYDMVVVVHCDTPHAPTFGREPLAIAESADPVEIEAEQASSDDEETRVVDLLQPQEQVTLWNGVQRLWGTMQMMVVDQWRVARGSQR